MNGMSEREYSTHSGLSRGAVQNAKRGGRLVFYADGSINAAASDVRRAGMTDPDQQRRSLGGDAVLPTSGSGGTDSYLKARTALTVYQAQERQLAIQKKEGHVGRPRAGRGVGVPPGAARTRCLGDLACPGGGADGRASSGRSGKGISQTGGDRGHNHTEGAGCPCPRAA